MTHPNVCVGCTRSNVGAVPGLEIPEQLFINVCSECAETLVRERVAFEAAIRDVVNW